MDGSCTRVSADGCPLIITGSGAGSVAATYTMGKSVASILPCHAVTIIALLRTKNGDRNFLLRKGSQPVSQPCNRQTDRQPAAPHVVARGSLTTTLVLSASTGTKQTLRAEALLPPFVAVAEREAKVGCMPCPRAGCAPQTGYAWLYGRMEVGGGGRESAGFPGRVASLLGADGLADGLADGWGVVGGCLPYLALFWL